MELFMQDVQRIDVPAYSSNFQVLCHPEEERVVREGEAWLWARAEESGVRDEEGDVEKLIDSKLGQVASQQFCGFVLQAFFTLDSSKALLGLDLLPTRASARSLFMPSMAITLLVEWWAELRAGMSTRQQARFCSHFADYILVHARQARFEEEKKVPGLEEYMRIRMVGGAMYVVEMLAEHACGIELDEEDLRSPSVKRLNEAIGLHAGLINDYVGFATEYERGEYFNILTVLHYRNNVKTKDKQNAHFTPVPFNNASAEAWAIIVAIEEECVASSKAVQEWAYMHSKPGLLKYVASLCSISAANWLFTAQSSRFTDFNKHCIQISVAESDLQCSPKSNTTPITRIFLTHSNTGHP